MQNLIFNVRELHKSYFNRSHGSDCGFTDQENETIFKSFVQFKNKKVTFI